MMLQDKNILIIEDNVMLALDLSYAVADYGGRPIGPAVTAAEALRLLEVEQIEAAVVDCHIAHDDVAQIVMCLAERDIPVVITAITAPPPVIAELLPYAPILRAPIQPKIALRYLVEEVARKQVS